MNSYIRAALLATVSVITYNILLIYTDVSYFSNERYLYSEIIFSLLLFLFCFVIFIDKLSNQIGG